MAGFRQPGHPAQKLLGCFQPFQGLGEPLVLGPDGFLLGGGGLFALGGVQLGLGKIHFAVGQSRRRQLAPSSGAPGRLG